MTIKKKTSKDKSQQEQSGHDHHSTSMMQSGETSSSRGGNGSGRSRMLRHSSINPNNVVSIGTGSSQNQYGVLASVDSTARYSSERSSGAFAGEPVEGSISAQMNPNLSENYTSDRQSLVGKRRHGRTSPHGIPPYAKGRPLQSPDHNIASSSSGSYHRNKQHTERSKSMMLQASNPRSQRRRLRSKVSDNNNNSSSRNEAGYNSEDEYDDSRMSGFQECLDWPAKEKSFEQELKEKLGFFIRPMDEDGSCLFRAVADQVYGDQHMADEVRRTCMDYMTKNGDYFRSFVTENFDDYVRRKRLPHTHGNNLEMQAMAEIYNRAFEVYEYNLAPINTFQTKSQTANPPIRVSYHRHCHYNSVVDPYAATIGVGLGLPSFHPGMADKNLLDQARQTSENEAIEAQMLADKLRAADRDYTEEALLREIRDRSLQEFLRTKNGPLEENNKVEKKEEAPPVEDEVGCSFSEDKNEKDGYSPLPCSSHQRERTPPPPPPPEEEEERASSSLPSVDHHRNTQQAATSSQAAFNGDDWVDEADEMSVLQRILMQSQQEYYEQLRTQAGHSNQLLQDDGKAEDKQEQASEQQQSDDFNLPEPSASCSRYPTNSRKTE